MIRTNYGLSFGGDLKHREGVGGIPSLVADRLRLTPRSDTNAGRFAPVRGSSVAAYAPCFVANRTGANVDERLDSHLKTAPVPHSANASAGLEIAPVALHHGSGHCGKSSERES